MLTPSKRQSLKRHARTMTRPAPQHVTAQSAFSRTLKGVREAAGLSRSDLAARMGYTNLSKGASKLALWERGDDLPRGDQRPKLTAALPAVAEALGRAIEAQKAQTARRAHNATTAMAWERSARAGRSPCPRSRPQTAARRGPPSGPGVSMTRASMPERRSSAA